MLAHDYLILTQMIPDITKNQLLREEKKGKREDDNK